MKIMTNTTCYNIEGTTVCTPEDIDKFRNYGLIGLAILAGVVLLGVLTLNNASIIGTELLDESSYYLGF
jgi:hypothetical protein